MELNCYEPGILGLVDRFSFVSAWQLPTKWIDSFSYVYSIPYTTFPDVGRFGLRIFIKRQKISSHKSADTTIINSIILWFGVSSQTKFICSLKVLIKLEKSYIGSKHQQRGNRLQTQYKNNTAEQNN